jgi:hypothetical protein
METAILGRKGRNIPRLPIKVKRLLPSAVRVKPSAPRELLLERYLRHPSVARTREDAILLGEGKY